jgi:hypothetical protein
MSKTIVNNLSRLSGILAPKPNARPRNYPHG